MSKGPGKLQRIILNELIGKDGSRVEFSREEFYLNTQCCYYDISIWKDNHGSYYGLDRDGNRIKLTNVEDELNRRRASISQSLKSLLQHGYVEKDPVGHIGITSKGKQALNIKSLNT